MRVGTRGRAGIAVIAAAAACLAMAPGTSASGSCSFNPSNHTFTLSFGGDPDLSPQIYSIDPNQIFVPELQSCPLVSKTSVDTIHVTGGPEDNRLTINLREGQFQPGFTAETGDSDEIEWDVDLGQGDDQVRVYGADTADHIVAGSTGSDTDLNLNADEALLANPGLDADVVVHNSPAVELMGFDGGDTLSDGGGFATGDPSEGTVQVRGLSGDDHLQGAGLVEGGSGSDDMTGTPTGPGGSSNAFAYYGGALAPVTATAGVGTGSGLDGDGGTDTFHGIQAIEGSPRADHLNAGPNAADLFGDQGADVLTGGAGGDLLEGGPGNDQAGGGGAGDILRGGSGADDMSGGDGADQFGEGDFQSDRFSPGLFSATANGADVMTGGPGTDTVRYGDPNVLNGGQLVGRTLPIRVTLDGVANDGQISPAEGDNVKPDVENVFGGKASDVLTGSAGPNDLFGFAAGDTINGATGADRIAGDGSAGFLGVVDGDNKLTGGQGADLIAGAQGDDRIEVQDGVADQVFCLGGSDTGDADSIDTLASDCGGITVHPLAPTFSVSPATKNFGSRAIAAGPTAAQTFTVTNRGTAGLHISDVKVTGTAATQFKKTSDACRTQTVAPGKTCAVKLTFDPSTKGQKAAQLSFTDGASGSPHKVTLQGRGT